MFYYILGLITSSPLATSTPVVLDSVKGTPKTRKIRTLRAQLQYWKKKEKVAGNLKSKQILPSIKRLVSPIVYNFISSQVKFSGVSKFGRRWSIKDKNFALRLYASSPKAYRSLSKYFHFPSVTTLRKCVSGIKMTTGFSETVLEAMKSIASKFTKPYDNKCIVSFDEMKLKPGVSFDIKQDVIVGFENYGSFVVSKPRLATHVLVFMVRGLCKKWKQAFGYFFSCESTSSTALKHLLDEGISKLVACGLDPVAVVCDQGSNNQKLYTKEYGISEEKPYFDVRGRKVYALFDGPHLLKSLRNNFKKYKVKFIHKGLTKIASWEHIVAAWEKDSQMVHRMAPKVTRRHVEVDGLSKMNVRMAAQTLSHSVSSIICFMSTYTDLLPASATNTADFCAVANDLFDSINGRRINDDRPLLSAVHSKSPHLEAWKNFADFFRSVEFQTQGKKIKFPCLNGWLITLSAFRQMIPELLSKDLPYILMSRFNQDCLENFFSVVRRKGGNNDHPTPMDFKSRVRMLMAEHVMNTCSTTNCQPDEDTTLVPLQVLLQASEVQNSGSLHVSVANDDAISGDLDLVIDDVFMDDTEVFDDNNLPEVNAGAYVGGYVAKIGLKKFQCEKCEKDLTQDKLLSRELLFIYFKQFDNVKNGLKAPSESMLKTICLFGKSFHKLFDEHCNDMNFVANIVNKFKVYDHDWLTCTSHAEDLWEYIVRKYVLLMTYHKVKRVSLDLYDRKRAAKKCKKLA